MRQFLLPALCLLAALHSGCSPSRSEERAGTWQRTELYFGLSRRGAPDVSEEEWRHFVTTEVVPAFPGGFTELSAMGHFSEDGQSRREPVRVLVVLNPPEQAAAAGSRLDALGRSYCRRFNQDAVLRADAPATLSFLHAD
jgi:hypothetical protein